MPNISFLKHAEIDKNKWDECIKTASNKLIYGYSFYLDMMSAGWDALIQDNYKVVMPLTGRKKFGISYLYQPVFTQQLGIFSKDLIDEETTRQFIKNAAAQFSFIEINLNYGNEYKPGPKNYNLVLPLNRTFDELKNTFRKDLVTKAKNAHLVYENHNDVAEVIHLFKKYYSEKIPHVKEEDYRKLLQLCSLLKRNGQLLLRQVKSSSGNTLSVSILYKDDVRIYYILSATLPGGRSVDANAFLLYEVIKEFSGQELLFDFEGSNIPSIRFFFKKFGAIEQPYASVQINQLPMAKKMIKKVYDRLK